MSEVDLAIAGGGIAGCALAIAMARAGWSVVVLERDLAPRTRPGEMLSPAARAPLTALGLWPRFTSDEHQPCFEIRAAWGNQQPGRNDFLFNPYGHGWHLDRAKFVSMLWDTAEAAGARLHRGVTVADAVRNASGWRLVWDGGNVRARFLADATGRARRVLRGLPVASRQHDRLICWYGCLPMLEADDATTWIEADSGGWWYSMPVPGGHMALAYLTDSPSRPPKCPPGLTRRRLGDLSTWWPRAAPASSSSPAMAAGTGWIALGDSAAAHDPLSGRGIVHALTSASRAAEAVSHALMGDDGALITYAAMQRRAFDEYLMRRRWYYQAETRWPEREFWWRRQIDFVSEGVSGKCV